MKLPETFLYIHLNQLNCNETGGSTFLRNVGTFYHHAVQEPRKIPSFSNKGILYNDTGRRCDCVGCSLNIDKTSCVGAVKLRYGLADLDGRDRTQHFLNTGENITA